MSESPSPVPVAAATITPTSAPNPDKPIPEKIKRTRYPGLLDKRQLAEISTLNTLVSLINGDPGILARIGDDQIITAAFLEGLDRDLRFVNQFASGAVQAVVSGLQTTAAETDARTILVQQIHYLQSKAKVKYAGNTRALLGYGIGTRINANRPTLEAAASTIIEQLKTDTLPKITAQHAADLQAALDTFRQRQVDQTGKKGDSTTLRRQVKTLVASLSQRRRQLQHAADGEYPYTDPNNAGIRHKCGLPVDRPLSP